VTNRIYAYTVVGKDSEPWERDEGGQRKTGRGQLKVGQTSTGSVKHRIKQQLGTAYPNLEGVDILLDMPAVRADGTEFTDHDVHRALVEAGIRRVGGEWFEAELAEVEAAIEAVKAGRPFNPQRTQSFKLRPEQQRAVDATAAYFDAHPKDGAHAPKFLWNAKMRFGKTFTTYELAKKMGWNRILVLTYKPAVATAWRDDLASHVDFAGWNYIDRDTDPAEREAASDDIDHPLVWFASLQDLGGKSQSGSIKEHNENLYLIDWDCIVIDEYHFGAWRETARDLYDPEDKAGQATESQPNDRVTDEDLHEELGIEARCYLYLSGTPFRAITNGEFSEDAIFNWTYVDEQRAKQEWDEATGPNPYAELPKVEMYSYQMDQSAERTATDTEFNGFSLNDFFKAHRVAEGSSKREGRGTFAFDRPDDVLEFLRMLRGQLSEQQKLLVLQGHKPPFPYQAGKFTDQIRHAVWYMPDVASCWAMADMLAADPFFMGYEVVVAAGASAGMGSDAKPPVELAIAHAESEHRSGSITLSCGKLMTGVTIREWGAILMLRSLKSPESYFQAAFRVQSPWAYRLPDGTLDIRKHTCYIFEFDPNRALALVAEYGGKLASTGDTTPRGAIGELVNYLPIFAFDGAEMRQLNVTDVLDWATAGIGATALAARWNSPLLVEVNDRTLEAVLHQPTLLEALDQIEDFRALVQNANQVITSSQMLKKAKREQDGKLDLGQRKEQSETNKRRKEIREKLQKFLAKIPVFMYVTDFREEALKDVIEALDSSLFERVTGLTVDDFHALCDLGLFNAANMNAAIYQFRNFERASLRYALDDDEQPDQTSGGWSVTPESQTTKQALLNNS
jgi:hypothetical protein